MTHEFDRARVVRDESGNWLSIEGGSSERTSGKDT